MVKVDPCLLNVNTSHLCALLLAHRRGWCYFIQWVIAALHRESGACMTIGRQQRQPAQIGRHGSLDTVSRPGLRQLRGTLLAQTDPAGGVRVASWADRPGGGLVITGRDGLAAAQRVLADGFGGPVLVDAECYLRNRTHRRSRLSASWIDWQHGAGLPVALTDSAYIGPGDTDALRLVLAQAGDLGPGVVAVLPLHASWLVEDLDELCAEVSDAEMPIALVIEYGADPLGLPSIVDGLLRLLLLGVPVLVLRADVSALGLLCFGGYAAAVGLRTNLRCRPPRRHRPGHPSVLVPQLLRFVDQRQLDAAMLADPDAGAQLLWCDCDVCGGAQLSWLDVSAEAQELADAHAVSALLRLRDTALASGAGSMRCQDAWAMRCVGATRRHQQLAETLYGLPPQPALATWAAAAGTAGRVQPASATNRS